MEEICLCMVKILQLYLNKNITNATSPSIWISVGPHHPYWLIQNQAMIQLIKSHHSCRCFE